MLQGIRGTRTVQVGSRHQAAVPAWTTVDERSLRCSGGGVGAATPEPLLVPHAVVEACAATDAAALLSAAPLLRGGPPPHELDDDGVLSRCAALGSLAQRQCGRQTVAPHAMLAERMIRAAGCSAPAGGARQGRTGVACATSGCAAPQGADPSVPSAGLFDFLP